MKRRLFGWLLALVLILTLFPAQLLAGENTEEEPVLTVNFKSPETNTDVTVYLKKGSTGVNSAPSVPSSLNGKIFLGWYDEEGREAVFPYCPEITQSGTVTFTAKYAEEKEVSVTFLSPEGDVVAVRTGKTGETVSASGVTFDLNSDEAVTGWKNKDGEIVESVKLTGTDVTLQAVVEKGFWVTFESNGGSLVEPVFCAGGKSGTLPSDPEREGYHFSGWYFDEEFTEDKVCTQVEFAQISGETTLYAKWTAKIGTEYTVLHFQERADDDGYTFCESEVCTGAAGEQTAAEAKNYLGFAAQEIEQQTIKGDGSTVVSIYYKREVYSIVFKSYTKLYIFGGNELARITAKYGAYIGDQWPTVDGSDEWTTEDNSVKGSAVSYMEVMPYNGATLWGPYTGNGGTVDATAYYYREAFSGETPEETVGGVGYVLMRSHTLKDHESYYAPTKVTQEDLYKIPGYTLSKRSAKVGDVYRNARFYYNRNTYTLKLVNGETEVTHDVLYRERLDAYDAQVEAPAGKEGWEFAGWYDNEQGVGEKYDLAKTEMPAQDLTLYAVWTEPACQVTFLDTDRETVLATVSVKKGGKISEAEAPAVEGTQGKTFIGWAMSGGGLYNWNSVIQSDLTLYARVSKGVMCTLTYDGNGAVSGSISPQKTYVTANAIVAEGTALTAPEGKTFLGWNTEKDGSGTLYYPGGQIYLSGDTTLYAVWGESNQLVTVTYMAYLPDEEHTETKKVQACLKDGKIRLATYAATGLSEKVGYSFAKWEWKKDNSQWDAGAELEPGEEKQITLLAIWTPREYTYTISYRQNGTGEKIAEDLTGTKKFNTNIVAQAQQIEGYTPVSEEPVNHVIDAGSNEITVWYYKNVELFANSAQYNYDGREKSVSGFSGAPADAEFSFTLSATRTDAGVTSVCFDKSAVGTTDQTGKYIVTRTTDGKLTVNQRLLTIFGDYATRTYTPGGIVITSYQAVGLLSGHRITGFQYRAEGELPGTYIGYIYGFDDIRIYSGKEDVTKNYLIRASGSQLVIEQAESLTVHITGNTKETEENGSQQSVTGYTTDLTDPNVTLTLKADRQAVAQGSEEGTYSMGLKAEDFEVVTKAYKKVELEIEDGWIQISKKKEEEGGKTDPEEKPDPEGKTDPEEKPNPEEKTDPEEKPSEAGGTEETAEITSMTEPEENQETSPDTGDGSSLALWLMLAVGSLVFLLREAFDKRRGRE